MSRSCVVLGSDNFSVSRTYAEKVICYSAEVNCCIGLDSVVGDIFLSSFKVCHAGCMLAPFP